jgi:triacylglycerol esterase/lipase EstA (alpha/beta hydrolase family)
MLARLQQTLVLSWLLGASLWVALTWAHSPVVAVAGLLASSMGHAVFLALEFVAVYRVNRHDPAPRAGVLRLVRAWLAEALVAPRVFVWQQPFRWNAVPDCLAPQTDVRGRRGIVFIHGFVCNRGFWNPWLFRLRQSGHAFAAVSLEPVFGSIEDYVPLVEAAVQRVTAATGEPPVLICHSMGGLAARAWLRAQQADARVHHVITIGTPHHGTWLGRFSPTANGQQMALHSAWLRQLARDEPAQRSQRFTCYYSNCDNIVLPTSVATLPGADNRLVPGVPHVALAFERRVMSESLALVDVPPAG